MVKCLICESPSIQSTKNNDITQVDCYRCGIFSITYEAKINWRANFSDIRKVVNASGWIRENQNIIINSEQLEFISSIKLPSVAERAEKIMSQLEKKLPEISTKDEVYVHDVSDYEDGSRKNNIIKDQLLWLGITYSISLDELKYLLKDYLDIESGFLDTQYQGSFWTVMITPKGYAFLENLKKTQLDSQVGFCAMWFDQNVLSIWTDAISPAIKDSGYIPKRIDGHQHNNRIDDEIIAMLRRSKFVVADFTGQRGGVYFEAGFALGLGLQVIWTCEKSDLENVHFDNRQYNFVLWESNKLSEFKVALQNRIEATIGQGNSL